MRSTTHSLGAVHDALVGHHEKPGKYDDDKYRRQQLYKSKGRTTSRKTLQKINEAFAEIAYYWEEVSELELEDVESELRTPLNLNARVAAWKTVRVPASLV